MGAESLSELGEARVAPVSRIETGSGSVVLVLVWVEPLEQTFPFRGK